MPKEIFVDIKAQKQELAGCGLVLAVTSIESVTRCFGGFKYFISNSFISKSACQVMIGVHANLESTGKTLSVGVQTEDDSYFRSILLESRRTESYGVIGELALLREGQSARIFLPRLCPGRDSN